ncbi:hypothetical protein ACEZDB_31095 [Streptacidiphilus sp. N1-3]|uniref:Uncharacterized protein n=1 Tax=Streptacidiphilus alkalitolerans TaxID=3342712 RepID=A0ABV6XA50_9ACTN
MTTLLRRTAAVLLASTALLLPARAQAASPAPDPDQCVPPAGASATGPVRIALDWSAAPVAPGSTPSLGIRVTNTGDVPTAASTLVVVHLPAPNSISAPAGTDLTLFGTGGSYTVPAGLAPGATSGTVLTLDVHAEDPPNTTQHCDVTSFTGDDHATVPYDVVTGDPVVALGISTYGPVSAAPGATVNFGVVEHNAGPSNAYRGTTAITMTAPEHTRWTAPLPYGCTADPARSRLSCDYQGSPLVWRDEAQWPNLTLDPGVEPGTVLGGGELTIANPWDCGGVHRTPFGVTVTPPAQP